MQEIKLPAPTDWHTADQLIAARPYLTLRSLKTYRKEGLRFSKRGRGNTAICLYKLADVDEFQERFVKNGNNGGGE